MGELSCEEVTDSAPGYALDILEPAQRDSVDAHLGRCPNCRRLIAHARRSADDLLTLGETGEVPLPRRRIRVVVSMAAIVALVVGTAIGPELEQAAAPPARPVASAFLTAGGRQVGVVRLYAGRPPLIQVRVDPAALPASGRLECRLTGGGGTAITIGQLRVDEARAGWTAPAPAAWRSEPQVILTDSSGTLIASASLS